MRYFKFMLSLCVAWCMYTTTEANESLSSNTSAARPGAVDNGYQLYRTPPSAGSFRSTSPDIYKRGGIDGNTGGATASAPMRGGTYRQPPYRAGSHYYSSGRNGHLAGKGYTAGTDMEQADGMTPLAYIIADEEKSDNKVLRRVGRDDDPGEPGYEPPVGDAPLLLLLIFATAYIATKKERRKQA